MYLVSMSETHNRKLKICNNALKVSVPRNNPEKDEDLFPIYFLNNILYILYISLIIYCEPCSEFNTSFSELNSLTTVSRKENSIDDEALFRLCFP